jgi:hypothetical protein
MVFWGAPGFAPKPIIAISARESAGETAANLKNKTQESFEF